MSSVLQAFAPGQPKPTPEQIRRLMKALGIDKRTRCIDRLMRAGANRKVAELLTDRSGIPWALD